uniref:Uncharacterized protein n=1 Tax=viral metagenome TaxID=1070528 RepID=A0A6C0KXD8_9ZZZZ
MSFVNAFIGVPQSRYAAFAVITAMLVVSLTILFGNDAVPLSQKFAFVFMLFLVSLPGLLLSLFQLTCIVVGAGKNNQRPWCSIYAWIISILLIIYCALLIILAVMSLTSRSRTMGEVAIADAEKFVSQNKQGTPTANFTDANKYAAQMFTGNEKFDATATTTTTTPAAPSPIPNGLMPPNAIGIPSDVATHGAVSNPSLPAGVSPSSMPSTNKNATPPVSAPGVNPTQPFKAASAQNFHNQKFTASSMPPATAPKSSGFHNQKFTASSMPPATAPKSSGFHNQKFTAQPKSSGFHTQEHFEDKKPQHFISQTNFNQGYAKINGQADIYGDANDQTHMAGIEPFDGTASSYSPAPPSKFGLKAQTPGAAPY